MPKLTAYQEATKFDNGNDIFIKDGQNGTKKITAQNAAYALAGLISPENRRNIYRGKSLGTSVSSEQWSAISGGTFDDMFIGDYWTLNGRVYRIADMDYWYGSGSDNFKKHHLVMVPDASMGEHPMNSSSTTAGAYLLSEMYTKHLPTVKTTIKKDFGAEHVLSHMEYFHNGIADGHASTGAIVSSDVELMNEVMVCGCHHYTQASHGTTIPNNATYDQTQLALFRLNPKKIITRYTYWLRDVVSSKEFTAIYSVGNITRLSASSNAEIRPSFLIGV